MLNGCRYIIRALSIFPLICLLSGCSGNHVKKYDGAVIGKQELAFVFTRHIEGSNTWIIELDGELLNFTFTRILDLKPGLHRFTIVNSPYAKMRPGILPLSEQDSYWALVFPILQLERDSVYSIHKVEANLKPGFTYVPVPLEKGTLDEPAKQLCLAEEHHDSPAARVNISGELRYPSTSASMIGCAGREAAP